MVPQSGKEAAYRKVLFETLFQSLILSRARNAAHDAAHYVAYYGVPCAIALASMLFLASGSVGAVSDRADDIQKIAAIVNDQPISSYDLEQYSLFLLATSSLPETEENKKNILQTSLNHLIEDRLQLQEAQRLSLNVEKREVEAAIDQLAARNRINRPEFQSFLKERGVDASILENHILADLAWRKVIENSIAPRLILSPQQIDATYERALEDSKQTVYLLSEIHLTSDGNREEESDAIASQIHMRLQEGIAFDLLASQFSEASSAAVGGDMGWVPARALEASFQNALNRMAPGSFSDPIKTDQGYYIFFMRDRLDTKGASPLRSKVRLTALTLPSSQEDHRLEPEEEWREKWSQRFSGCSAASAYAKEHKGYASDMGEITEADLSPEVRAAIRKTRFGQSVSTRRIEGELKVLILCGREQDKGIRITRQSVETSLLHQHLDLMARKRLRELRREAHVELR